MDKYICCICGKEFDDFGNDPWPVVQDADAKCCDECNWNVIVPVRIRKNAGV